MLYAFWAEDVEDSLAKRRETRAAHVARLTALQQCGRLVIAGPCPAIDSSDPGAAGMTGSLIVAEFADFAAAQAWADCDPYIAAGVYKKVTVKPYIKVL